MYPRTLSEKQAVSFEILLEAISLQVNFAIRAPFKLFNITRIFPSFSWRKSSHMTRLDLAGERKYWMNYKAR